MKSYEVEGREVFGVSFCGGLSFLVRCLGLRGLFWEEGTRINLDSVGEWAFVVLIWDR